MKEVIQTAAAPEAIGAYSQAIKLAGTLYVSGQIPLDPETMQLVSEDFEKQATQVFKNLRAVCLEAGIDLEAIVKLNISVIDLKQFDIVNKVMEQFFVAPYPARATVQVAALPRASQIEVEAIACLSTKD